VYYTYSADGAEMGAATYVAPNVKIVGFDSVKGTIGILV